MKSRHIDHQRWGPQTHTQRQTATIGTGTGDAPPKHARGPESRATRCLKPHRNDSQRRNSGNASPRRGENTPTSTGCCYLGALGFAALSRPAGGAHTNIHANTVSTRRRRRGSRRRDGRERTHSIVLETGAVCKNLLGATRSAPRFPPPSRPLTPFLSSSHPLVIVGGRHPDAALAPCFYGVHRCPSGCQPRGHLLRPWSVTVFVFV